VSARLRNSGHLRWADAARRALCPRRKLAWPCSSVDSSLAVFLNCPRLDLAATLAVDRRAEGESITCRFWRRPRFCTAPFSLISWIGRSSAYRHAARYLEKLDAFSAYKDARSRIDSHEAYRAALSKKALAEKWLLESRQGTKVTLAV
jgi:hypothetical protein